MNEENPLGFFSHHKVSHAFVFKLGFERVTGVDHSDSLADA